jgi:transposase
MSQNTMRTIYAGLDLAKLNLQLHLAGRFHDLPNTAAGQRALYMAALVAARANGHLKAFYQRLRLAGKPAKVTLTALMRKLIVLMNQLLKNPHFELAN